MIDLDDFEKQKEMGPLVKFTKSVMTPMPGENEENNVTCYKFKDYLIRVHKVSTTGWSVTLFEGDEQEIAEHKGYFDAESEAHMTAQEMVEGRLLE